MPRVFQPLFRLLAFVVLLFTLPAGGQPADELEARLQTLVAEGLEVDGTPGVAVALVSRQDDLFLAGFGLRERGRGLPVTPETIFAIGSTTKAFTAAVVADLVEESLFDWDQPVADFVPGFRMWDDYASLHTTPRDLLSHRSGVPGHTYALYRSGQDRSSLFARLRHFESTAELRARFQYSNLMYVIAGHMAETVAAVPYEEMVRRRLLEPLGMQRTGFSPEVGDENLAMPHGRGHGAPPIDLPDLTTLEPAGGLYSSVADLARWLRFNLGSGEPEGREPLLQAKTLAELHAPQIVVQGGPLAEIPEIPFLHYALGWNLGHYRGARVLFHAGGISGYTALVALLPDQGFGVAVLANRSGSVLPSLTLWSALDLLLGLEPIDWRGRLMPSNPEANPAPNGAANAAPAPGPKIPEPPQFSHPLHHYAGRFEHPGYGPLRIQVVGDGTQGAGLQLTYHGMSAGLVHRGGDHFTLADNPELAGLTGRFRVTDQGQITHLTLGLERGLEPLLFGRELLPSEMYR